MPVELKRNLFIEPGTDGLVLALYFIEKLLDGVESAVVVVGVLPLRDLVHVGDEDISHHLKCSRLCYESLNVI